MLDSFIAHEARPDVCPEVARSPSSGLPKKKLPTSQEPHKTSLRSGMSTMTMTMTMTLEVQHLSMKAWPYKRECRGHDPAKKRICCTDEACSIGKVFTNPLLRTVCSTSNHEMSNDTQAVAGMNSRIQSAGILGF